MTDQPAESPNFESTSIIHCGETYTFFESDKLTLGELADALGYSTRQVVSMKAAGCPFFGRYSTVQIVRRWEYFNPQWRR